MRLRGFHALEGFAPCVAEPGCDWHTWRHLASNRGGHARSKKLRTALVLQMVASAARSARLRGSHFSMGAAGLPWTNGFPGLSGATLGGPRPPINKRNKKSKVSTAFRTGTGNGITRRLGKKRIQNTEGEAEERRTIRGRTKQDAQA